MLQTRSDAVPPAVAVIIRARRAELKRRRKKTARPVDPPRSMERRYQAELLAFVRDIEDQIRVQLIDRLPALAGERDALARMDAWDDEVDALIRSVSVYGQAQADRLAAGLELKANSLETWNRERFAAGIQSALGVDILSASTLRGGRLQIELNSWVRENTALIRSIPADLLTQVEGITQRGLRGGRSARDIAAEIRERFPVTEARARLIGRDQISKLNGQISRSRQESIGVDKYIWRDASDERVRPDHAVMSGLMCRWDDPTVYSDDDGQTWQTRSSIGGVELHPGEDYQCRCGSEAVLDEILAELDE